MAEYLSPGVYIEEKDFRSSTIEGVSTTTTGFVGPCLYGPDTGEPVLITSFEEFEQRFGGLKDLHFGGRTTNFLAFAVRGFFANGGRRCYIARIHSGAGVAASSAYYTTTGGQDVRIRARYPGRMGNVNVSVELTRSQNLLSDSTLRGVRRGDMIEVAASELSTTVGGAGDALTVANVYWVDFDETGAVVLKDAAGTVTDPAQPVAQRVTVQVTVTGAGQTAVYQGMSTHPVSEQFIGSVMRTEDLNNGVEPPYDRSAMVWFDLTSDYDDGDSVLFLEALETAGEEALEGGTDGTEPGSTAYEGSGSGHDATGLNALAEVSDIAIVAAPAAWNLGTEERHAVRDLLITHCELQQYRFAIVCDGRGADESSIRQARAKHDTSHAAMYYPWVVIKDPAGGPGQTLELPPDGYIAGIFARSDIQNGVHKAPANEPVRGILRFNRNVTTGHQDVLNPAGVNCLRFFEGRGNLVWGARTMSSDPLWRYVNVRRLFIYLEHSIDVATQWVVFEPNNHTLWTKVRLTVEAFLRNVHRTGALLGKTPEEAFFVRCDRTTMTLNDLDNGRLVCLIGVAPTRPAEFVIFRIGQWTAEASLV